MTDRRGRAQGLEYERQPQTNGEIWDMMVDFAEAEIEREMVEVRKTESALREELLKTQVLLNDAVYTLIQEKINKDQQAKEKSSG